MLKVPYLITLSHTINNITNVLVNQRDNYVDLIVTVNDVTKVLRAWPTQVLKAIEYKERWLLSNKILERDIEETEKRMLAEYVIEQLYELRYRIVYDDKLEKTIIRADWVGDMENIEIDVCKHKLAYLVRHGIEIEEVSGISLNLYQDYEVYNITNKRCNCETYLSLKTCDHVALMELYNADNIKLRKLLESSSIYRRT